MRPLGMDEQLVALMTPFEIRIDLRHLRWDRLLAGNHDHEINNINNKVCEMIRTYNNGKGGSWRILIEYCSYATPPLFQLAFFEAIKELVGLETLVIFPKFKTDLKKLETFLEPSLGRGEFCGEWERPLLEYFENYYYDCVILHPRKSLAERLEQAGGNTAV